MKLHANDDDNEYLQTNIKSYWYENEEKHKTSSRKTPSSPGIQISVKSTFSEGVRVFPWDQSHTNSLY